MRQRRDKTAPPAPDNDAVYAGIPRDADGHPVYLILSEPIRTEFEEQMSICDAAWREWRDPLAISDATTRVHIFRQPIPAWLERAIAELAHSRRTKAHAERRQEAVKQYIRYECVLKAKLGALASKDWGKYAWEGADPSSAGILWDEAYAEASDRLKGTFAEGEPATMKAAYAKVRGDAKAGRFLKYGFHPRDNRFQDGLLKSAKGKAKTS